MGHIFFFIALKVSHQNACLYVLLFIFLLLTVPHIGHEGDVACWNRWAQFTYEHGLANAYALDNNGYNPFYNYVLWLYGRLMGSSEKIYHYHHLLKSFTLLFDFAGALMISRLAADAVAERQFRLSLLLLLNIGYLYNTLIWEQVDAIHTFFAAAAVVLAVRQRLIASTLLFVLALNMKTQAIIFLPPLLLLWVPQWLRLGLWKTALSLLPLVLLQVAIVAPFVFFAERSALPRLLQMNFQAAEIFPYVTVNAYNLWSLLVHNGPLRVLPEYSDTTVGALGLTYRRWGLMLFCAASAVALLPLLLLMVRSYLTRRLPDTRSEQALVLLSFALVPLLFVYFSTQMHERYWHPALLFLAGYAMLMRRYWLFILLSVAYYLQLESVLKYLGLKNYSIALLHPYFIAGLFTIVLVGAFVALYRLAAVPALLRDILPGRRSTTVTANEAPGAT